MYTAQFDPNKAYNPLDIQKIREDAVRILLSTLGEDVEREGLLDTPKRVAKMYDEVYAGYLQSPEELLATTFDSDGHDELVLVGPIPFHSHCEHHMVPFVGTAYVAYIPNQRVVGISKLARLVDAFSKRLQIQERLTTQIADTIESVLAPRGVAVIVEAEHMCMTMRGVKKPGTKTTTSAMRGVFRENDNHARMELMMLINQRRG